ncbi:MAG TPA: NTTRR-F1 domain, partial [Virgibacillus sp.]|nr:NTTRR-F1 domain [Virgibacillus sp.]
MAINNLIVNGGFETGTLDGWSAVNANVSGLKSHAGRFSAVFMGRSQASLSQTVPISGDQSLELLVSLSKYSLATSPA